MILKILILTFFTSLSTSIRLQCHFHESSWSYKCSAKSISVTSKSDRDVKILAGHHIEGKASRKVLAFSAHSFEIFYFPQNLTQHFVNLKYISIQNSRLKEINSDDLEEFGDNLVYLWLCGNEIEIIERNLFSHNKNLGFLNLNGNKIKFFEGGAIEKLAYPHSLYFNKNKCFSGSVNYNEKRVEELVQEIEEKCTFGFSMKCQMNEMREKIESLEREKIKFREKIKRLESENLLD
jgi:hypothetical protein